MFIDVHCHLDMCENIEKIIKDAKKNNILVITNGINRETNLKSIELSKMYKEVNVALGIYPIELIEMNEKEIDKEIDFIKKNKNGILAIGEIGLDFKEDSENHSKQEKYFKEFIKLGIELNKPIEVHSRKAELRCIEILEKSNSKKVIMHCFSGNMNLVERIIKNGWFLSIPANVTFSEHFQKVVEKTPINQLLCETDSPYLHPKKEWPNSPINVIEGYKKISEIKKMSLKDVERIIEDNFRRLFEE